MTKNDFITELKKQLVDIPEEYVNSVVAFYENLFKEKDRGEEEQTVMQWGIPAEAAQVIRKKYNKDNNIESEEDIKLDIQELLTSNINIMTNINITPEEIVEKDIMVGEKKKPKKHTFRHLICILTIPIWGAIAFALTVAAIVLAIVLALITLGGIMLSVMAIIVAIAEMPESMPLAIMLIAVALCMLAVSGLLMLLTVWYAGKVVPNLIYIMGRGIKAMFGKEEKADEEVC